MLSTTANTYRLKLLKDCCKLCIQNSVFFFSGSSKSGFAQKSKNLSTMYFPPPEVLRKPLVIAPKILLGPGPSNPPPSVLQAMTLPMLGYLHKEFTDIMDEVKEGLQYVFQTKNRFTFAISGTGHSGMEASLMNLVEPGEKVVIAQHGLWGERAAEMAARIGANVHKIIKPPGQGFSLEEIDEALAKHEPVLFFICHSESTSGVAHPLEGLGDLCHQHNCLLLVDTVASLGGVPFSADQLKIDCVYSATQKVLGVPPGLAPVTFSEAAVKKILDRKTKPLSFYFDFSLIANYWGCFDEPRKYHHTAPITTVYGLREGLAQIVGEGLENVQERHRQSALRLHNGLESLGLKLFVKDPKLRLPTLTTVEVPENINWKGVVDHLMIKYKIEIAGGLGPTAGKIWRIGLMGYNSTSENVDKCLSAMKEALTLCKL